MDMSNIELQLKKYYQFIKEKNRLEYEVQLMNSNNDKLEQQLNHLRKFGIDVTNVKLQVIENSKKILKKELRINEIIQEIASLDYIISQLEDEDKQLLELRYKRNYSFDSLIFQLHKSKSSLSRRKNKVLKNIDMELCNQRM